MFGCLVAGRLGKEASTHLEP
ncbi:RIKEN cDNA 0610007P06, isoform CRA_b [Mus musculus]|nr:RIKEN cDNA 0610007P06, isoform CRA_b [Mus musculus]EDL06775.1 RIKEN cDNA 0610007P06, isoform CRA_b [Mus musculus]